MCSINQQQKMELVSNLENSQLNTSSQKQQQYQDDCDIINYQNILKYEELINDLQIDLNRQCQEQNEEQLLCCDIKGEKKLSVRRNKIQGVVKVRIDLPCSMGEKFYQKVERKSEQKRIIHQQKDGAKINKILKQQEIMIEKYKEIIEKLNEEIKKYKQQIDTLTKKQQHKDEIEFGHSDLQIHQIQQSKYQDIIDELENKIKILQSQQSNEQINTLTIIKGQQISILDLQPLHLPLQQNQSYSIKYFTSRQLLSIFQQPTLFASRQFQQLTNQYSSLLQTSSTQIKQLKSQISSLFTQLNSLKIQNQKYNTLILQYQIKLSNRRDFYKLKLIDLQYLIKEKTKHLNQLNNTINSIQDQIQNKMNGFQSIQPLIASYTITIQHINSKLEQQQSNTYELQLLLLQKNNKIQQLNRTIEEFNKQIEFQNSRLNEVNNELSVKKSTQDKLLLVINKLQENIKDLNVVIAEKNKQISQFKERTKIESENQEDMKLFIDDMTNELMLVKQQLFIKRQEYENLEERYRIKQQELKQYESQIRLQALDLKQLIENKDRTEEVILELRSKIEDQKNSTYKYDQDSGKKTHYESGKKRGRNSMVDELKRIKLGENNISVQMVLKLIEIIEEYGQDINNLENQNGYLKQLVIDYQQIIEKQLLEIKRNKIQNQPQSRLGKRTLNRIRSNNSLQLHKNNYLSLSTSQLQYCQQLASDLQKQRKQNIHLNEKLKQTHKQLMQSEREIFQKTQAINYLNLALIKASNQQTTSLQQEITNLKLLNQNLEENMNKIIRSKTKQIENLEYQINLLDNNVIPQLKNENTQFLRTIEKLESENNKLTKQLERGIKSIRVFDETKVLNQIRLQKNNLTLEQFKLKKLSYSVVLYMMLRLIETLDSTQHMKTFHPEDIHIINFNENQPSSFKIKLSFCQKIHNNGIFTAPQILKGQPESIYSISWNFGLIFDYLFFKQPFYLTQKDVTKKIYQVRGKIPYLIQKLLQSLIVKQKRKRLSLQQCKKIVQIQLNKQ